LLHISYSQVIHNAPVTLAGERKHSLGFRSGGSKQKFGETR
jgi:hypothetical protein